jgi:hypothetical protein
VGGRASSADDSPGCAFFVIRAVSVPLLVFLGSEQEFKCEEVVDTS